MKKTLIFLAVLFLLLGAFAQSSLAYSTATGCVVDGKTGQPWTHGGVVTVEYPAGSGNFISYTTNLDANGCFDAQLWPSGVHVAGTLHIDPSPGPAGDPDEILCQIPADSTTDNYDCGTMATNTGPNAVLLLRENASGRIGPSPMAWGVTAIGLLLVVSIAVILRRRKIQAP